MSHLLAGNAMRVRDPRGRVLQRCCVAFTIAVAAFKVQGLGFLGSTLEAGRGMLLRGILAAAGAAPSLVPQTVSGEVASAATPQPDPAELVNIANAFLAVEADPARAGGLEALQAAEQILGAAIVRWEGVLQRSAEERSRLRMGRAKARVLQNDIAGGKNPLKAKQAIEDYNVALQIMDQEFKTEPNKAMYSEYPDALVRRGLAKEEIKDWAGAVADYSRAIDLWRPDDVRGPRKVSELGVNPLVLNFRGNALSQLGRYQEAINDYQEATAIFATDGELRQASLSRCNEALALYGDGSFGEAEMIMRNIVRKDPGVTDMHVALAAVYWQQGKVSDAESEWLFACEKISSGCQAYKDPVWVTEIRRWPPNLAQLLLNFQQRIEPAQTVPAA